MEAPHTYTSTAQRYQYQIPSKLQVEDKVVMLGPLSLTLRQAFVLILGGMVALNIWRVMSAVLPPGTGSLLVRCTLAALPAFVSFVVAMKKITGRYSEIWFLILLRYYGLPKIYHWCRLHPSEPDAQRPSLLSLFQIMQVLQRRSPQSLVEDESE